MNIIFLTLSSITDIDARGIYTDLMRRFRDEGHQIYIVSPAERKLKISTSLIEQDGIKLLKVKTFNIQKTNIIEKGIGILAIEYQYFFAIKEYLSDIKFEIVLYSTPPITFSKVIWKLKIKYGAKSYLLLKDIFPQNAVDIGMMKKNGLLHFFFRRKEKKLYALSDYIGCMSPANVRFLLVHNPDIAAGKAEICPNSIELMSYSELIDDKKLTIKSKLGIPKNVTTFVYGGNLGKPQGIEFLLQVLDSNAYKNDRFFVIVGSGTEFSKIQSWFDINQPKNAKLISGLPKSEYDELIKVCDVGMIFLDPRFTIPNYPSRLLSYLENKMPILAATDTNTDMGTIAEENGYGFWTLSGDLDKFNSYLDKYSSNKELVLEMGLRGYEFLKNNYTVEKTYQIIMQHFSNNVQEQF
jgi:glycosyltransferase involved in cell wall biosynthesis